MKLESTLVGVAGEYFVAAELSRRGYLASITLRNSRGVDIIASNADASRSVSIQVKTSNDGRSRRWMLTKKADAYASPTHYYVFVTLRDAEERPEFHIVPSAVVAQHCSRTHREWIQRKKADGTFRKDSDVRVFTDPDGTYREAWRLLGLAEQD
jgi:hypothetical protein